MKIAYILPSLVNKGPIVVVNNLVRHLCEDTVQIDVYYFEKSVNELAFPCPVYLLDQKENIPFDNYDIIHSHTLRADYYLYKNRNKIRSAKTISTIHQDTFVSFSMKYNKIVSFFLTNLWCYMHKKFDGVIAISEQLKSRYFKLLGGNLTTIYNGCDLNLSAIDEDVIGQINDFRKSGHKMLCSYAFITNRKGLSQVLEALVILNDFKYIVIGEGPGLEDLKVLAKSLRVSERVLFLPYVNGPYQYLTNIDVYVMPSYSEGFGLAMIEASLQSKAIVCSNIDSFRELLNSEQAVFFDLDNIDSLSAAIERAFENKEVLGRNAKLKASSTFTSQIMANNHLNFYRKLTLGHE